MNNLYKKGVIKYMDCIILKKGKCEITQNYSNNHQAIDLVGLNSTVDDVIAHSDGKVIFYQDGYSNLKGSTGNLSYGNCIKIDHGNGYSTLYAHLEKGLNIKNNDQIKKGQCLVINNICRIDYDTDISSMTFYVSNSLKVDRISLNNPRMLDCSSIDMKINKDNDLVFEDVGFVKFTNSVDVRVYYKDSINLRVRDNLI